MSEENDVGKYRDALTWTNKLARAAWIAFTTLFFRPFAGPIFRCYRSLVLRLWGAKVGKHCAIAAGVRIWAPWNLKVGDYVSIANGAEIYDVAPITMGNHVTVSQDAYLCTASHDIAYKLKPLVTSPITLCDFSWVCAKSTVLLGVSIAEGAVVAACAVATKDVPPWSVVGGNPAKFIKRREVK